MTQVVCLRDRGFVRGVGVLEGRRAYPRRAIWVVLAGVGDVREVDRVMFGLWVPNYGVLADVSLLADLAVRAEMAGWDGWFLHDHVVHEQGDEPTVDPWMALAVAAFVTSRVRLGTLVTPLPRRRPWNVARQAATLDRLAGGRAVLGVGIGSDRTPEFAEFGEVPDLARRASMLDEGLQLVTAVWRGEPVEHAGQHYRVSGVRFGLTPVQQPLPVWVAAIWPAPRPLRRARGWQGVFPLGLPGPDAVPDLRAKVGDGIDVVVPADEHPALDWERAGATWWLQDIEAGGPLGAVQQLIDAGPPNTTGVAQTGRG